MNSRKPTLTRPMTPITRASITFGTLRLKVATAAVQPERISAHSNNEPSCAPQTPEIRYSSGRWELEFFAA